MNSFLLHHKFSGAGEPIERTKPKGLKIVVVNVTNKYTGASNLNLSLL